MCRNAVEIADRAKLEQVNHDTEGGSNLSYCVDLDGSGVRIGEDANAAQAGDDFP